VPGTAYCVRLKDGRGTSHLNQNHDWRVDCDWDCRMHGDAERAMIGVGIDLVNVRHLNDGKQREQEQAHEGCYRQSSQLCAALSAPRCLKMCQETCP
jgi:hypothetical protein